MKRNNLKNYEVDKNSHRGVRYVGAYYTSDMSATERRKSGSLGMIAGIIEMLLIIVATAINCMGNRTVYVIIPLECILFCALYYVVGAYTFFRSADKMEQKAYEKAVENPVQITLVAVILNIVSFIGQVILIIRKAAVFTGYGDYFLLGMILVILALHIVMYRTQKKLYGRTHLIRKEE